MAPAELELEPPNALLAALLDAVGVEPLTPLLDAVGVEPLAPLLGFETWLPDLFLEGFSAAYLAPPPVAEEVPPTAPGAETATPAPAPTAEPAPAAPTPGDAESRPYDVAPAGGPPPPEAPEAGLVPAPARDVTEPTEPGGGPPTTAEAVRARVDAATTALPLPRGPTPAGARAPIDATTDRIAARTDREMESLRQPAAGIVGHRPGHRRLPAPDPGPIPKQMAALHATMGCRLDPATLPAVTRSPRGTLPDLAQPVLTDLEILAVSLGEPAILALTSGTDPATLAERDKLETVRQNLGGHTAAASQPDISGVAVEPAPVPASVPVVDEPLVGAGLTPEQRGLFALVVADLRADPADQANRVLRAVRLAHPHFPGGALDRAFSPPLTAGLLPEVTQVVAAEAGGLAQALALTPDQLDEAVRLRREQVQQMRDAALDAATGAAGRATATAGGADARKRAAAHATAAGVARSAAVDRAPAHPPNRTQHRVEQAMADLQEPVATELARLDEQLRLRERAIADAVRAQVSAIRLAQAADEVALRPPPGTRGTTQDRLASGDVRRWADAAVDALETGDTSARASLVAAARTQTGTFKSEVRRAASDAIAALRAWGTEHAEASNTWWADLDARLATWSAAALDAGKQWEDQQGQASRIALAQDLESIKRISALKAAGATEEANQYLKRLDGEASAVILAFSGGGAPDLTAALSAGIRERVRARNHAVWEDGLEQAVFTMPIEQNFEALDALLTVVQPGWKLEEVTAKIHKAVTRWRGHDEESIFEALSGLSPLAARLLPWYYEKTIGQSLEDALLGHGHVGHLSTDEMDTAHQLLRGDRVEGAVGAIHSALSGPGAEMGAVNRILRSLSPAERALAITQYQIRYDQSLESELKEQWTVSQSEVDESMAIAHSDLTGASAIALQRTVKTVRMGGGYVPGDGEGDRAAVIDRAAAAEVYAQVRRDVEAEGAQKRWTSDQIEAEITVRSQELGARFDERAADQWWVRNQPPGTTATEAAFALASPAGKDLLNGLATNDLVKIDVAKIQLEDEGRWASDAAINAVFRDQAARSLTEAQRDMGPILQARTDATLRQEEATFANAEQRVNRRMELERENAAELGRMANDRTRTRMDELGSLYELKSGRTLTAMVEDNMSFTAKKEALARVAQRGVLTNYQQLKFAIEGLGTDMPLLRSTLATMSPEELAEADREWREHHDGEALVEAIKGDTSGREQTDLVDMATCGAPQTAEQVVEAAERKLGRDQKSATLMGSAFTERESAYAAQQVALLRTRLEEMRRSGSGSDAQWRATTAFDIAVDRANTAIELQRQALDEVTDLLANAASIVTAIVVGAALAPFTAGGSAVVAAAVISSLAATAVSITVKQAMKGAAYGSGEFSADLAIGAVDALVSALTAGLGHGLLGRAAGGASTMRSLKLTQALGKMGALGRAAAQSRGLLAREASRFAFLEGLDQSKNFAIRMIGRGTAQLIEQGVQAVPSSFAGSLLDESVLTDPRGPALVFEHTVSGTLQSTAMGLGLAAAHHVGTMGWHGAVHGTKALVEGIRVLARPDVRLPTGDVLAHAGTPAERLTEFREWRRANPAGTAREFIGERRAALIESWQLSAEQHERVREARGELLSGLPAAERGRYADLPVRSVADAEFARLTGRDPADAHLLVREGQAVLLVREGAAPGAVAALLPAVQERVFPGTFGMTVEAALPRRLRDTPIRIDTTLPHDEIRVVPVPPAGPITGVQVVVGPGVHPIDVGLHAGEVTRMRRWTGRLGEARQALARFTERFGLTPLTPEDRTRFEAAGEVRKLGPLIEERMRRLSMARDPAEAATLERRALQLLAQQERAHRILSGELQAEPRGYVAQGGEPAAPAPESGAPLLPAEARVAEAIKELSAHTRASEQLTMNIVHERTALNRLRAGLASAERNLVDAHDVMHEEFGEAGFSAPSAEPGTVATFAYSSEQRTALRAELDTVARQRARGRSPEQLAAIRQMRDALTRYEALLDSRPPADFRERTYRQAVLNQHGRVLEIEASLAHHEAEISQWRQFLTESLARPGTAAPAPGENRMFAGTVASPLLPAPNAGFGYFPEVFETDSLAKALAHLRGAHAEGHLANRVAEDLHQTVVEWGDKSGIQGADVASVDKDGVPVLWDSKYRSAEGARVVSPTFTTASALDQAALRAIEAVIRNPGGRLTPQQQFRAVWLLGKGDFVAYTVTSNDARTFHSAMRSEFHNGVLVKTEQVTVPWGSGK